MRVFNDLKCIENMGDTAVALGSFDGVHKGHEELIRLMVSAARQSGLASVVFAFSENPKAALGMRAKKIISEEEKAKIIESLGVDFLVDVPFDESIRTTEPRDFAEDILASTLRAKKIFCGFNYRFGHGASGRPETLAELGFDTHVLPPYMVDGETVSSTRIRELIESGDMEKCARFLGRSFTMRGIVVIGNRLGRTIGFPTVNINICDETVTPPNGVYVTVSRFEGRRMPSITNVGNKPTVGNYGKNVETHIFCFDRELYGAPFEVEFISKLRDEKRFSDIDELRTSIARDCDEARRRLRICR